MKESSNHTQLIGFFQKLFHFFALDEWGNGVNKDIKMMMKNIRGIISIEYIELKHRWLNSPWFD